jgi:hypothetical protein
MKKIILKKDTLVYAFLKKEAIFWKRNYSFFMSHKADWLSVFLVVLLSSIGHYCFAIMAFVFETYLWARDKKQFRENISRMSLSIS